MSDPAAFTATTTAPPDAGGHASTLPPAKIVIQPLTFNSDCGWPVDLKLGSGKGNWQEWDKRLRFLFYQRGLRLYLEGTLPRPDESLYPEAACAWDTSDMALRGFIFQHISDHDYDIVSELASAHKIYDNLRNRHQKQGPFAKVKTIRAILDTQSAHGTPLCQTFDDISKLHSRYIKMGPLTDDQLLCIFVLNSLRVNHPRMQTSLNDMLANPLTTSTDIRNRLEQEDQTAGTSDSALAAVTSKAKPPRPLCANCRTLGHRTEYCIAAGGQMAGKTIEEARAAREAARNKQRGNDTSRTNRGTTNTANTANVEPAQPPANVNQTITVNGVNYIRASVPESNNAFSAIVMPPYDEAEYLAVIATTDEPKASLNWSSNQRPAGTIDNECAFPAGRAPIQRIEELPFILDSGATCHISPEASDFKNLRSTPRRPVKGLCGTAVYAVGMGDIELRIANGHTLKLTDALYIPESSVRLISILALNKSGNYTTHFDSTGCWVTNHSNTTLVRGTLSGKRLYVLTTK